METNLTKAVADDNFEAFAEESNQAEIAARLGTKPPEKKSAAEPAKAKAEPEVVEVHSEEEPKPKSPHKLTWGQLRAKLREQEAEIRGLKEGRKPAEVIEEREVVEKKPEQLRARPKAEDKNDKGEPKYKTWEEYEDDLLDWNQEKTLRAIDERGSKRTQETQIAEVNKAIETSWNERCEAAAAAHEDFDEALDPELGPGKLIQPGSIVDEWILDSELGAELIYFFHKNPAELKKFEKIEGPTPGQRRATARRMLMKIENKIAPEKEPGEPEETEKPKPAAEKPEPRLSRTPPPTREVGGRGAAPTDRARAAVANDDVGSYMDEMDRRDIARLGRR